MQTPASLRAEVLANAGEMCFENSFQCLNLPLMLAMIYASNKPTRSSILVLRCARSRLRNFLPNERAVGLFE